MNSEYASVHSGWDKIAILRIQALGSNLFKQVHTPDGIGLLASVDSTEGGNGLYLRPEIARCIVWYGTDKAQGGFVSREYGIYEVSVM